MKYVFCGERRDASCAGTSTTRLRRVARTFRVPLLAAALFFGVFASNAFASSGGNFVATGHDMDLHCSFGSNDECQYFKIVVDKVRNGSALPILALDQGSYYVSGGELPAALARIGEGPVVTVNPTSSSFATMPFVDSNGQPLYSAIITASDSSCGGCDNTWAGESAINARASDFASYFNAGGGIIALSGAGNNGTYYNFVPLNVGGVYTSPPYVVTADGAALGVTSAMVNCCPTHNSFATTPSGLVALETDRAGHAETLAAFGATITTGGGGGFTGGGDTTPPVLTLADVTAEATSSSGADVTYAATATDETDGAVTPSCSPASGSTFALGVTEVDCTATDAAGNSSSGSFNVTVVDTTPPTLTLPADIAVDAASPAGAAVTYSTSATDIVDGATSVTCSPASGSTFAIGTTSVNCSSTDAHGNTATGSFTVHVRSAAEMTAAFCPSLTGVGSGTSLSDKCMDAANYIAAGDTADAIATLKAFNHEVKAQRGKKLTAAKADSLTATANSIIAVLGG